MHETYYVELMTQLSLQKVEIAKHNQNVLWDGKIFKNILHPAHFEEDFCLYCTKWMVCIDEVNSL